MSPATLRDSWIAGTMDQDGRHPDSEPMTVHSRGGSILPAYSK